MQKPEYEKARALFAAILDQIALGELTDAVDGGRAALGELKTATMGLIAASGTLPMRLDDQADARAVRAQKLASEFFLKAELLRQHVVWERHRRRGAA